MMAACPECGKKHVVMWPQLFPFRRGERYYCSHGCWEISIRRDMVMIKSVARKRRKGRNKNMNGIITDAMRKNAVDMALKGESPLKYLKECGAKNPSASWQYIRKTLEKNDPETYGRLPEKIKATVKNVKQVETPEGEYAKAPTVKVDGPLRIETKEADKVEIVRTPELPEVLQPAMIDGMPVREVSGIFGRYRYTDSTSAVYIDFEAPDNMDVISLTVEQWQKFREEQVKAAKILGVKL